MKIVIVGPRSVGKSTVSSLLSKELKLKYLATDALMDKILKEEGGLDKVTKSGNVEPIMFKGLKLIEDIFKNENNFVLDLAGGSVSSGKGYRLGVCQKIIELIGTNSIVIGLYPYADLNQSVKFLQQREKKRDHFKNMDFNVLNKKVEKDCLRIKSVLDDISENVIYVADKGPNDIVEEIISKIKLQ